MQYNVLCYICKLWFLNNISPTHLGMCTHLAWAVAKFIWSLYRYLRTTIKRSNISLKTDFFNAVFIFSNLFVHIFLQFSNRTNNS